MVFYLVLQYNLAGHKTNEVQQQAVVTLLVALLLMEEEGNLLFYDIDNSVLHSGNLSS